MDTQVWKGPEEAARPERERRLFQKCLLDTDLNSITVIFLSFIQVLLCVTLIEKGLALFFRCLKRVITFSWVFSSPS